MRQKSLALVEIIVSMVILSLVLLGITGMFVAGKKQLKRAQFKQEALNFAREKLEELEALDFDDYSRLKGDCPGGCEYSDESLPYESWKRTWRITDLDENFNPTSSNPQYKRITVTVEWQEP